MMQEIRATESFNENLVRKSSGTTLLKTMEELFMEEYFHVALWRQH